MTNINEEFMSAIRANNLDSVTKLLENDANVNTSYGLIVSAVNGNWNMVIKLLDFGANVNYMDSYALRTSYLHKRPNIVAILLERGANLHCRDEHILVQLQKNFDKQMADAILPYCYASDHKYFPKDYICERIIPTKSANSRKTKL